MQNLELRVGDKSLDWMNQEAFSTGQVGPAQIGCDPAVLAAIVEVCSQITPSHSISAVNQHSIPRLIKVRLEKVVADYFSAINSCPPSMSRLVQLPQGQGDLELTKLARAYVGSALARRPPSLIEFCRPQPEAHDQQLTPEDAFLATVSVLRSFVLFCTTHQPKDVQKMLVVQGDELGTKRGKRGGLTRSKRALRPLSAIETIKLRYREYPYCRLCPRVVEAEQERRTTLGFALTDPERDLIQDHKRVILKKANGSRRRYSPSFCSFHLRASPGYNRDHPFESAYYAIIELGVLLNHIRGSAKWHVDDDLRPIAYHAIFFLPSKVKKSLTDEVITFVSEWRDGKISNIQAALDLWQRLFQAIPEDQRDIKFRTWSEAAF
jgi:hypothetical protein